MTHKKEVVFSLLFVIMVLCTGCSDKDNGDTSKNNRTSGESFVQEETIESTDNTDNADGSSAPTPELKTPRTKKELEDARTVILLLKRVALEAAHFCLTNS